MFKKFNLALAILVALGTSPSIADPFGSAPIGYSGSAPSTGGGGGGGTPGGSSGQVQYNAAGSFAGITGATTDGTTLTLVAPVLGTPASGDLSNATNLPISTGVSGLAANIAAFLGTPTSANLAAAVTNETGSGLLVFGTSPTLTTPVLGAATGTSIALGGATLGANAFAVTGTAAISGATTTGALTSSGTILAGASSNIGFTGRSLVSSAADGNVALTNNAASSFGLLQLGGTTSSFPALKRSTTVLQARLADDSAFTSISVGGLLYNGSSSGVISILPQAAAGTYNFNLPTTAGTAGQLLASGGGVGAPMTWVAAGAGTVTSVSAGQGITTGGSPITSTGTVSTTEVLGNSGAVITGTTYTVNTTTDAATQLVFTGSSPSAFTLGSPVSGVGFDVVNQGSATVTVTATGNINGSATLSVAAGSWAHIFANSTTTWYAETAGSGGSSGFPITIGSTSIASGSTTTSISGLTLVAPALGTPTALVLTNATGTPSSIGLANGTGLPVSTGISGLGTGVATFLATPSSANLASALTDETGTGVAVFSASPTLTGTTLASALTLSSTLTTNVTGTALNCLRANSSGVVSGTGLNCGASDSNWVASNWYNSYNGVAGTGVAVGTTTTEWVPVFFDKPVTIGNIGARITTADAAGNMQFAVYAASISTGLPTGSALCTTASISTASTGSFDAACTATGSPALASAGRYWFGYQTNSATATVGSYSGGGALNSVIGASSHSNLSGSATNFGTEYKTTGGTYATWASNPSITQAGTSGNQVPMVQYSLSSVP